jgi:hypothetical protein
VPKIEIPELIQADLTIFAKSEKIAFLFPRNTGVIRPSRAAKRGVSTVTKRGAGSDGRDGTTGRVMFARTMKACGPDAPVVGVKLAMMLTHHAGDGDNKARFTRESTYKS